MKENKSKITDIKDKIILIFKKIWVLILILCIAYIFYTTRSVIACLIVIPVGLIVRLCLHIFFETSENDTPKVIMKMPKNMNSKVASIISVLKKIWVCMIILSILGIAYIITHLSRFPPTDKSSMKIEFSGAPEGTVYADILGKIDSTDESYSDFNFIPNKPLADQTLVVDRVPMEIDENSEIARYNEDGYMSLSIHSSDLEYFDLDGSDSYRLYLNCNAETLYKKYGKFRIAYVGEHGEVLGVTKKTSNAYYGTNYGVSTDGKKAIFIYHSFSPLFYVSYLIIYITKIVTLIIIPVHIINKICWKQWVNKAAHRLSDRNNDN